MVPRKNHLERRDRRTRSTQEPEGRAGMFTGNKWQSSNPWSKRIFEFFQMCLIYTFIPDVEPFWTPCLEQRQMDRTRIQCSPKISCREVREWQQDIKASPLRCPVHRRGTLLLPSGHAAAVAKVSPLIRQISGREKSCDFKALDASDVGLIKATSSHQLPLSS